LKKRDKVGREMPLAAENSSMVRIRGVSPSSWSFIRSGSFANRYVRKNLPTHTIDNFASL